MKKFNLLLLILAALTLLSFVYRYKWQWIKSEIRWGYPKEIEQVLELAGENRGELETVLDHYNKGAEDSLKFQAALFLIRNMPLHGSPSVSLENNAGLDIFSLKEYSFSQMKNITDSVKFLYGGLQFEENGWQPDLHSIKSDFLIRQIDLAFSVWKKPWNKYVNFDQFCRYILPYRSHYEPIEPGWREYYTDKFLPLLDTLAGNDDPVKVASLVNDSLGNSLKFRFARMHFPRELSFTEGLKMGGGMCEDLTNQTVYAMRSVGIPVVVDYTPLWPKNNMGHQWLSLVAEDQSTVPFDGIYRNPHRDSLRVSRSLAKAFRHHYNRQVNGINPKNNEKYNAFPNWMSNQLSEDVTRLYEDVTDLIIPVDTTTDIAVGDFLFLGVFNNSMWQPIHWGEVGNDRKVLFESVGKKDIIYVILKIKGGQQILVGDPFLINYTGNIKNLSPGEETLAVFETDKYSLWNNSMINDNIDYELFYWNKGWKSLGTCRGKGGKVRFENIPKNTLYRLVPENVPTARIFLLDGDKMLRY